MANTKKLLTFHVYRVPTGATTEKIKCTIAEAETIAENYFSEPEVYKVKVWDESLGPIVPNVLDADALLFEVS